LKSFTFYILVILLTGCDKETSPVTQRNNSSDDSTSSFPVRFITFNYIELDKIERISKFRSGIGHDYSDGGESCRSKKHYFQPKSTINWSSIKIFAPVSGSIVRINEEWAGTQLWIRPFAHSVYTIIIFHISLLKTPTLGDTVIAGEQIGYHIGPQTMSDIAIGYSPHDNWQLLSFFQVMADSLFTQFTARGAVTRDDFIISKTARDADSLNCRGEVFGTSGTLENWVILN